MIAHTLHRHEPPVTENPIEVVFEDDRLIVINKPAGVPVHPAGRYNFNSVIEIMKFERNGVAPLRMFFFLTKVLSRPQTDPVV